MKIPEPRKLKSGTWFIQLRLGGESIPVSADSEKECRAQARYIKAEYLAGKREKKTEQAPGKTLHQIIDDYIASKNNTLSPSTIRGYRNIQKNRFQSIMQKDPAQIPVVDWQRIVNEEAAICSPKYLKSAWSLVHTATLHIVGISLPKVQLPAIPQKQVPFLLPDEIPKFIAAVADTKYATPALLALSSLRVSEIAALQWEDIPQSPKYIQVSGATVPDETHTFVRKAQNKNRTSTRKVPIMIPALADSIERDRLPCGPVLQMHQRSLRRGIHAACEKAGVTKVSVHGLRHSFASLAYHLGVPERVTMEIGGWSDTTTMHKIYTHIAQSDLVRYATNLTEFFEVAPKNANEIANEL